MPSHQARRDPLPKDYQFPTPGYVCHGCLRTVSRLNGERLCARCAWNAEASKRYDKVVGQKAWDQVQAEFARPHQWWCAGRWPCACTDDWKQQFAPLKLDLPTSPPVGAKDKKTGISLRFVREYDVECRMCPRCGGPTSQYLGFCVRCERVNARNGLKVYPVADATGEP